MGGELKAFYLVMAFRAYTEGEYKKIIASLP
jgi:hypothetical protein